MSPVSRPGQPLLEVEDLSVHFGSVRALDGVRLAVGRGEVVALVGENGAGKSTLVRCVAGDVAPTRGTISVAGRPMSADPGQAARAGVAVVWQDLALCDNLDVASNLMLGGETRRMLLYPTRLHGRALRLLSELGIPLDDSARPVGTLSGGQRQLVAVARAMRDQPRLLVLDEPTAALGVAESEQVEELISRLPPRGTGVLLISHDLEQAFRLAHRLVVLRHGRLVASLDTEATDPDEVVGLVTGQRSDAAARRQLSRLHTLTGQLASAAPSTSLALILAALQAALGQAQLCLHVYDGHQLHLAGSLQLAAPLATRWSSLSAGSAGGPVGRARARGRPVVSADVTTSPSWAAYRAEAQASGVRASWCLPFAAASGLSAVITILRAEPGPPTREEMEMVALYSGYVASALERDKLTSQLSSRNRVLETIREVLEILAGPVPLEGGLMLTLASLRVGLAADEVAVVTCSAGGDVTCRATVGPGGPTGEASPALVDVALHALSRPSRLPADLLPAESGAAQGWALAATFPAPEGMTALVARSPLGQPLPDLPALMEDAANSLRLAFEREASERARLEARALRDSQELQRRFLSSLSHELRTPLTAIRGYASSLLQPDVEWDEQSQQRFLTRISDESSRLGRLVDDLLDFSAIDAGILRIQPDWCDLALVVEAARSCLPLPGRDQVEVEAWPGLPVIWADHDRVEQVVVNLLDNAVRHNPPGTRVSVQLRASGQWTEVVITDDGLGIPAPVVEGVAGSRPAPPALPGVRRRGSGAGLGLSIARGILLAHRGELSIERLDAGTRCVVRLPAVVAAELEEVIDG
jgi:ABC-type multidrug transport system ATPase subunit/signal transduction histidine kinase